MEQIESILEDVLRGEAVNDDGAGCVDYSIQDQLAELGKFRTFEICCGITAHEPELISHVYRMSTEPIKTTILFRCAICS